MHLPSTEKPAPDEWYPAQINGDIWNVYLVEDDDEVIAGESSSAETDFPNREIFVRRSSVELTVILHELWHAYAGYCYLAHTENISIDDAEEVAAALFSDRGQTMLAKGVEIHQALLKLRDAHG